ncbi:hypothetical protein MTO96_049129 [Rhipicephalus appendiculatus]
MKADCPHEPSAVQELIVEGEFRTTLDGREFLRRDCTSPDEARLLIFFTDENIRKLNDAKMWLMDGTCKTVSPLFEQLYTIHGYLHGHVFAFVYCVMTRRTQMAYEALLEEVLNFAADVGLALNSKTVSTDFDLAAINAIRSLLPSSEVHGCLFHLCQSVWRRVQHLGLAVLYKNDVDGFAIKVRQLAALSFLPTEEVRDKYASLKPLFPQEASDLLRWWEDHFLLGKSRRRVAGACGRRRRPGKAYGPSCTQRPEMTPGSHHDVEYAVFGVFVAASLFTGLYFALGKCRSKPSARTVRSGSMADEEFLGGRSLGMLPLALSVLASMVTATGLLGFTSHFYAYGMHLLWGSNSRGRSPAFHRYIRMRFGNQVGIAACVVYFFLTEIQGAVSIFAAAVAISTFFHMPLLYCSLAIGAAGTLYTALGGMRGVVWTDSVQGILILICPLTILGTIVYDSLHNATSSQLRPFSDIDMKPYFLQFDLDFTRDENVWSCAVGLLAGHAYRMGMDQMVVQRYASAKSLREAQRTAFLGSALLVISTALLSGVAMALVYWYRDCDPLLSGAIKNIEQIIPYYIKQRLSAFPGHDRPFPRRSR